MRGKRQVAAGEANGPADSIFMCTLCRAAPCCAAQALSAPERLGDFLWAFLAPLPPAAERVLPQRKPQLLEVALRATQLVKRGLEAVPDLSVVEGGGPAPEQRLARVRAGLPWGACLGRLPWLAPHRMGELWFCLSSMAAPCPLVWPRPAAEPCRIPTRASCLFPTQALLLARRTISAALDAQSAEQEARVAAHRCGPSRFPDMPLAAPCAPPASPAAATPAPTNIHPSGCRRWARCSGSTCCACCAPPPSRASWRASSCSETWWPRPFTRGRPPRRWRCALLRWPCIEWRLP